jgi:membrane protein implicated in regulation of membrane protease activity
MRTPVAEAARNVAEHASSVAKLELRLASLELKKKVGAFAVGIGLGIASALLAFFMLAFGLATIAAALATFLSWWLALLIVTVALLLVSGLLGMLALGAIKKASPPLPEQAIREAKLTTAALKS